MTTTLQDASPIIIAHRGASGYRPEHTLAAYELAITLGADYIEPDLVSTKDGILIARHENEISETTNVASHAEFAHLQTTKIIDGESKTGWFTEDFTLRELKTLRAKERIPQVRFQNTTFDGILEIPTLQEIIDLVKVKSGEINREIGIYLETKHPTYFQSIGLALELPLLATLTANGYQGANAPVFIQSFEVGNLQDLSTKTDLPLVQLLNNTGKPYDFVVSGCNRTYADLVTPSGLEEIAQYAQAIGIHKNLLVPRDSNGKLRRRIRVGEASRREASRREAACRQTSPTSLVTDAHAAGLLVHVWTFRNEDYFLPLDFQGNPQGEYELFFSLGVDGVFSDYPDTAFAVREKLQFELCSP